jgi:SnoaL-like polyketide cyclase
MPALARPSPRLLAPLALALVTGAALHGLPPAAQAQPLGADQARALVTPFYDALNAAPGKDVAALIERSTAADWLSCSADTACSPRDKVIGNIAGFGKAIPDLRWEIKDLMVAGDRVVVRGEASGTPAGPFMGVPHGGRSFRIMSIDVHMVKDGRIARTWHLEDWMGASRQLAAK